MATALTKTMITGRILRLESSIDWVYYLFIGLCLGSGVHPVHFSLQDVSEFLSDVLDHVNRLESVRFLVGCVELRENGSKAVLLGSWNLP